MSVPEKVVPFRRPADRLAYAPGVAPFDGANPVHIAAWNALFAYGQAQRTVQDGGAA